MTAATPRNGYRSTGIPIGFWSRKPTRRSRRRWPNRSRSRGVGRTAPAVGAERKQDAHELPAMGAAIPPMPRIVTGTTVRAKTCAVDKPSAWVASGSTAERLEKSVRRLSPMTTISTATTREVLIDDADPRERKRRMRDDGARVERLMGSDQLPRAGTGTAGRESKPVGPVRAPPLPNELSPGRALA